MPQTRSTDRRVQKTRGLLHGALTSLIHEKSFDDIVVKEILARANVGRSTFYAHFRDKDELLDDGLRTMLRACQAGAPARPGETPAEAVVRFSLPLFAHIEQMRGRMRDESGGPAGAPRAQSVVHEQLQRVLADSVAHELRRAGPRGGGGGRVVPGDLLAEYVASTFMVVLTWWLGREEPLPAPRANDLFRSLVLPTLTEALG